MLSNEVVSAVSLLVPGAKADTAGATGAWIDIRNYEGSIVVVSDIGTVTAGSIAGKIRTATDGSGTGAADVAGATFVTVTTSNDPKTEAIRIACNACNGWIAYVGTVTTGPVDAGVVLLGNPKY